jgi:tyrosyl-tRNA synthetase
LSFADVVDLASNFTVQRMLERDIFQKRIAEQKPLFVHEFFYPLMQGYDSVALDVDVEIGGTDQMFNMLAGRTLLKNYKNKEKIVVTTTLLENPKTGEKLMSKSLGTGVGLDLDANDMFGKVMALPDEGIPQLFVDCTELSMIEIDKILRELEQKENFRSIKAKLAKEIVSYYHGKNLAEKAEENFEKTFAKGGVPDDVLVLTVAEDVLMVDILLAEKIVESKTEWRRLVGDGAVTNMDTGEKITDEKIKAKNGTYKIGKRRFVKMIN